MSSVLKQSDARLVVSEGIEEFKGALPLNFGGALHDVRIAWRLAGAPNAPVIAVLGGISAGRYVFDEDPNQPGWWRGIVGAGLPLDASRFRILGIDFLGGSGSTTGPQRGERDFPSISAYDQANVLAKVSARIGVNKLHAIVGASYGGMVALAFAEKYAVGVDRIVAISAADRAHPMSTAWRSVQRETVRALAAHGDAATGLKLARALAMATYRSSAEFGQRFSSSAQRKDGIFRAPVEDYLYARGQAYAATYVPEAFICLSESIDLHVVQPENIRVPTTLIAIREDQLVPLDDMRSLHARLAGPRRLVELSSLYGHDAFLKEDAALKKIFEEAL
jgi:homoserine O-acetyltransferase